jgi:hypothetical protein
VLKVSATFKYDRYIAGRALSLNKFIGNDNNKSTTTPDVPSDNPRVTYRTGQSLGNESGVRPTITNPGSVFPTVLNN